MIGKHEHICREFQNKTFDSGLIYRLFQPFLGKLTLLSLLPAIFYACGDLAGSLVPAPVICRTKVSMMNEAYEIKSLDFFIFMDDRLQKLDCYQRFDDPESWDGTVMSGSGDRIISAIANSGRKRADWLRLNSRSSLLGTYMNLEDEVREFACMSGEINTGGPLRMTPLASEIVLSSLCCDFSERPYSGERLSDIRVYLTNVNAECPVLDNGSHSPRRIINAGRLCEDDMARFKDSGLIFQEIAGEVGKEAVRPEIRLRCYENSNPTDTPGTPFTRLVIEGKVGGQTYYWPIDINRDNEGGGGIIRNRRYIYDIRITRKGSTDPDIPISINDITIRQETAEWKEIKEYGVSF